jgi:hypothetical protein
MYADGLGDLGYDVLTLAVRSGGLVHAADGGGLALSLGLRPRARAASRPSRVPSMISSRWNSSIVPRMWKTSRPVGVAMSICCLRTTPSRGSAVSG